MKLRTALAIIVTSSLLLAADAYAHIQLMSPAQRYSDQKTAPCGRDGGQRTDNVTVYEPGETITVMWNETVNHPGHFRISFDDEGDDDFADPADFMDFDSNPAVLADAIPDTPQGGVSGYMVTLPDIECDRCTLQVVQVMYDKPPYGDGNDLYYQCADLVLRTGGAPPPDAGSPDAGSPAGGSDAGSGSSPGVSSTCSSGSPSSSLLLVILLAVAIRQMRYAGMGGR